MKDLMKFDRSTGWRKEVAGALAIALVLAGAADVAARFDLPQLADSAATGLGLVMGLLAAMFAEARGRHGAD